MHKWSVYHSVIRKPVRHTFFLRRVLRRSSSSSSSFFASFSVSSCLTDLLPFAGAPAIASHPHTACHQCTASQLCSSPKLRGSKLFSHKSQAGEVGPHRVLSGEPGLTRKLTAVHWAAAQVGSLRSVPRQALGPQLEQELLA